MTEQTKQIINRLHSGIPRRVVAAEFNVTFQHISYVVKKYRLDIPYEVRGNSLIPTNCKICGKLTKNKIYCCHGCQGADANKNIGDMRPCKRCGQVKPKEKFYIKNSKTGQLYSHCKMCESKVMAAYNQQRKESNDRQP